MPSASDRNGLSDTPMILRSLGAAGLFAANGTTLLLGPGKPLALLTYLAMAPGRQASRETLLDLLWSDLDQERARRALRQSLFHLRRLVGEDLLTGAEELAIGGNIGNDRDEFLAALDRGDFEGAIAVYRGPFLPFFGVPGGAAFERWSELERARLQAGFIRAGELLVRRHLNKSRFKEARRVARTVRDLAPSEEAAWRLVLESAVSARDYVSAAVEATALEEWATRDQVVLNPATRAAITRSRRIVPASDEERATSALVAELTGREREFFAITTAWETVRAGPARHLHVSAAAGHGKTRLLRDALARLSAAGATVLHLRGTPGDRDVPFAFAGDLVAAVAALPGAVGISPASSATLLALNPALSAMFAGIADTATGEDALRRRIHAVVDLVQSVAHEHRFVLAVDDVHWLDANSLRVLDGLISRLNDAHVLCLTAGRLDVHIGTEHSVRLSLAPLRLQQVGELVGTLGAIPTDEPWTAHFVSGLFAATRGSPLLVLETLRLAIDEGMLSRDDDGWHCLDAERIRTVLIAGEALRERVRVGGGAPGGSAHRRVAL